MEKKQEKYLIYLTHPPIPFFLMLTSYVSGVVSTQFTMRHTKSNMWESQALQDVNNAIMRHKTKGKCYIHEHVLNIGKKPLLYVLKRGEAWEYDDCGWIQVFQMNIVRKYQQSICNIFAYIRPCFTKRKTKMYGTLFGWSVLIKKNNFPVYFYD